MRKMETLDDYVRSGRESQTLEFKSKDAISDSRILPRAVCAFLNAEGGEVIVGVEEVAGGLALGPISDSERARQTVRDRLLSSIEPTPPTSLVVEILEGSAGRGLRISVPRGDVVFALREKRGALSFVQRRQDRVVPMSWHEVQALLAAGGTDGGGRAASDDPEENIGRVLKEWRGNCFKKVPEFKTQGGLFVVARVLPDSAQPPEGWDRNLREWYEDPTAIGIRRSGVHFLHRESLPEPRRGGNGSRGSGGWDNGYKMAEYTKNAGLHLAHRLDFRMMNPERIPSAVSRVLHQLVLVELISSFTRVFGALWRTGGVSVDARAWIAAVITGTKDLRLPPYAHNTYGSLFDHHWQPPWEEDELGPFIASADLDELRTNPDRLAWRLLRALYLDFGYEEEMLPYFDSDLGRFRFE